MALLRRRRRVAYLVVAACALAAAAVWVHAATGSSLVRMAAERHPQAAWAPCNANAFKGGPSTFTPLSDAGAAALVTPEPETRPYNARSYSVAGKRYPATNDFVPSTAALAAFRISKTSFGQTVEQLNPYLAYVDGLDGMKHPSTDDLIQWAAHKWGIPENWLRAQYTEESYWNSFLLGDDTPIKQSWVSLYPSQARVAGQAAAYQSMGISQVRWAPDGSVDPGTEPLRWESTAFNVDFQAAMVRFYYDDPDRSRNTWGDASYTPCQKWQSIGGWNDPYPWHNAEQQRYIGEVKHWLDANQWRTASFIGWKPSSFPPGVSFP